jgi:hypothetical protein
MRGLFLEAVAHLVFLALPVCVIALSARGPVSRARVQRFAARGGLIITATNGEHVIRYLATTRRWRATGLAAGYWVSVAPSLVGPRLSVNFAVLFAGWFGGAVIAETRVAHLARSAQPVASLVARQMSGYVSPVARAGLPIAAGFGLALGATAVIARIGGADVNLAQAAAWLVAVGLVTGLIRTVQQRVLHRPQPPAEPDVIAADDAIRSRSLHVLAGAGAALVAYCAMGQLLAFGGSAEHLAQRIGLIATPTVAVLGWWLSTLPWRVHRIEPSPAPVPASGGGA